MITRARRKAAKQPRRNHARDNEKVENHESSPGPLPSDWMNMFKTVSEFDTSKVEDCKEDVDTVLVFAGLYSAVLTAFIIESYKNMQQDPQDIMVYLMQRSFTMNYTLSGSQLNSTSTMPSVPAFQPPLWAVRVNALWFISLVLSLSSASIGMLVKQWLREFLALEYTSPRNRLRARQYRHPSLQKWKVFEIAAILPLLLQLSLGLFFMGLCFFTSAIHQSVRNTTIPVVSAWAFFFAATTLAPLVSPRCPFKTTFLKATMRSCRRITAPPIRYLGIIISQSLRSFASRVSLSIKSIMNRRRPTPPASSNGSTVELSNLLEEEEDIVDTEQDDADILIAFDAIVLDDAFLPAMVQTLRRDPMNLVRFVIQSILFRTSRSLPIHRLSDIIDARTLSQQAWYALTDATANALRKYRPRRQAEGTGTPGWVIDGLVVLLSYSRYSLSDPAAETFRQLLKQSATAGSDLGRVLLARFSQPGQISRWIRFNNRLIHTLMMEPGVWPSLQPVLAMFRDFFFDAEPRGNNTLLEFLSQKYSLSQSFVEENREPLNNVLIFLEGLITRILPQPETRRRPETGPLIASTCRLSELLTTDTLFWEESMRSKDPVKLYFLLLVPLSSLDDKIRVSERTARVIRDDICRQIINQSPQYILEGFSQVWAQYESEYLREIHQSLRVNLVSVCQHFLNIQQRLNIDESPRSWWYEDTMSAHWRLFWVKFSGCLKTYFAFHEQYPEFVPGHFPVARKCLEAIESPNYGARIIPDELLEALGLFIPAEDISRYDRLSAIAARNTTLQIDIDYLITKGEENPSASSYSLLRPRLPLDSLVRDDNLLCHAINVLHERMSAPHEVIGFIAHAALRRLGTSFQGFSNKPQLTFIPDFGSLPEDGWDTLANTVSAVMKRSRSRPLADGSPPWAIDATILLLSRSSFPLPRKPSRILLDIFLPVGGTVTNSALRLSKRLVFRPHPPPIHLISGRVLDILFLNHKEHSSPGDIMDIYRERICLEEGHRHSGILDLIRVHCADAQNPWASDTLDDIAHLCAQYICRYSHQRGATRWLTEFTLAAFEFGAEADRRPDLVAIGNTLWIDPTLINIYINCFAAVHSQERIPPMFLECVPVESFLKFSHPDRIIALRLSAGLLVSYESQEYDNFVIYPALDVVRFCELFVRIAVAVSSAQARDITAKEDSRVQEAKGGGCGVGDESNREEDKQDDVSALRDEWGNLWCQCERALRRYHRTRGWERPLEHRYWHAPVSSSSGDLGVEEYRERYEQDRVLAGECLDTISSWPCARTIPEGLTGALALFDEQYKEETDSLRTWRSENVTWMEIHSEDEVSDRDRSPYSSSSSSSATSHRSYRVD